MDCDECETNLAQTRCSEWDQQLCLKCDQSIHKGGKRRSHVRTFICNTCIQVAVFHCTDWEIYLCQQCLQEHASHVVETMTPPQRLALLWDLRTLTVMQEYKSVLQRINESLGDVEVTKVYSRDSNPVPGVKVTPIDELSEIEAIVLDLSVQAARGITYIAIIIDNPGRLKPHVAQLTEQLPSLQVVATDSPLNLAFIEVSKIPEDVFSIRTVYDPRHTYDQPLPDLDIPKHQPFPRNPEKGGIYDSILMWMIEFAHAGDIMIDFQILIDKIKLQEGLSFDQARSCLHKAEKIGVLRLTKRMFSDIKTVTFISLRLETLSLESLLWSLRSLCMDEMLPTERAIQSRMKEAFDLKPSGTTWIQLLEIISKRKDKHLKSRSDTMPSQSFITSNVEIPTFSVTYLHDSITGTDMAVIYPEGEEWNAVDQFNKDEDTTHIKSAPEWADFVYFMEQYFMEESRRRKFGWYKNEDESRAIPGGRYGCAQFLHICGPPSLQRCSLGKLNYMVQVAIREDLLRYQRTLLVWTSSSGSSQMSFTSNRKLQRVQAGISEVLTNSRGGISLAQIPMYLKRDKGLSIDINELGFPKLKDLLLSVPGVKIELRGINHPFAIIERNIPDSEAIVSLLAQLVLEFPMGVPMNQLEEYLYVKSGHRVRWIDYYCESFIDFVQRYAAANFDIMRKTDGSYVLYATEEKSTKTNSFMQLGSGSEFYQNHPPQKIISVSNIPKEFSKARHESYASATSEIEDQPPSENESDISNELGALNTPHYRTDSVECYPSETSSTSTVVTVVRDHAHTQSEDLSREHQAHNRPSLSFDFSKVKPPPGFDKPSL